MLIIWFLSKKKGSQVWKSIVLRWTAEIIFLKK